MPKGATSPSNEATDLVREKRKALIISISDYLNDLAPLDFCKADGEEMYETLKFFGYEIPDNNRLIGQISFSQVRPAISKFFTDKSIKPKDTLIFYFSGHGIPDGIGEHYLATSDIDPDVPWDNGFSFGDLTKMMDRSNSRRIIVILDCCYSGSARLEGKGVKGEESAARLGREAIEQNIKNSIPPGEGRCILASSLAYQESFQMKKLGHSLFTYYLLKGLKGGEGESIDNEGNVTPESLSNYVFDKIMSLDPPPKQKPIKKLETAGLIILAQHPELVKREEDVSSIIIAGLGYLRDKNYEDAIKSFERLLLDPTNHLAYKFKGDVLVELNRYHDSIEYYDKASKIKPDYLPALKGKEESLKKLKELEASNVAVESKQRSSFPASTHQTDWWKELRNQQFLQEIRQQNFIPFIGPGACKPWIPAANVIANLWAQKYQYPFPWFKDQLPRVAQFSATKQGSKEVPKEELSNELRKIKAPDFTLAEYRNTPSVVLADLNLPIYITTNYDHFIEEALRIRGKEPISEFCRWSEDLVEYANENEMNEMECCHYY